MQRLAIIGAGDLGGLLARALVEHRYAGTVVLIDAAEAVARGKALDIAQSAPIDGGVTRVTGTGDLLQAGMADGVVVADRHRAGEWHGDPALEMLRRVRAAGGDPLFVFAGAGQREVMLRARQELDIRSARLIGSAPAAFAASARALVALEAGASTREVRVPIVGAPGRWVVAWSQATIGARAVADVLPPASLFRLEALITASWPPGPYALASAACSLLTAAADGRPLEVIAFVALDRTGDVRRPVAALPARVDARLQVVPLPVALSGREQIRLDTTLAQ